MSIKKLTYYLEEILGKEYIKYQSTKTSSSNIIIQEKKEYMKGIKTP